MTTKTSTELAVAEVAIPPAGEAPTTDEAILLAAPVAFDLARRASGVAAVIFERIRRDALYKQQGFPEMRDYARERLGVGSEADYKKTARAGVAAWRYFPDHCSTIVDAIAQGQVEGGVTRVTPLLPSMPNKTALALLPAVLKRVDESRRAALLEDVLEGNCTTERLAWIASHGNASGTTGGSAAVKEAPSAPTPKNATTLPDATKDGAGGAAGSANSTEDSAEDVALAALLGMVACSSDMSFDYARLVLGIPEPPAGAEVKLESGLRDRLLKVIDKKEAAAKEDFKETRAGFRVERRDIDKAIACMQQYNATVGTPTCKRLAAETRRLATEHPDWEYARVVMAVAANHGVLR